MHIGSKCILAGLDAMTDRYCYGCKHTEVNAGKREAEMDTKGELVVYILSGAAPGLMELLLRCATVTSPPSSDTPLDIK
jgi:hypothetical protein